MRFHEVLFERSGTEMFQVGGSRCTVCSTETEPLPRQNLFLQAPPTGEFELREQMGKNPVLISYQPPEQGSRSNVRVALTRHISFSL